MLSGISLNPQIPFIILLLTIVLVTIGVRNAYQRYKNIDSSFPRVVLRVFSFGLILLILLNPIWRVHVNQFTKPTLIVLLDSSSSMNKKDLLLHDKTVSRWEGIHATLTGVNSPMTPLSSLYDVKIFLFDQALHPITAEKIAALDAVEGSQTDIAGALQRVVSLSKKADKTSVLIISDGRDTADSDITQTAQLSKQISIPISTICLGRNSKSQQDYFHVSPLRTHLFAAPGETISVPMRVSYSGSIGGDAVLQLESDHKIIAARKFAAVAGSTELNISIPPLASGFHPCYVSVNRIQNGIQTRGSKVPISLMTLSRPINTIIIDGRPDWDTKFLADALRADVSENVDSVFQLTDTIPFALNGSRSGSELKVPVSLQEFSRYDIVILGSDCDPLLPAPNQIALKQWVTERGGSLILMRGNPFIGKNTFLELLPIQSENSISVPVHAAVTESGYDLPSFNWIPISDRMRLNSDLPALFSHSSSAKLSGAAAELAEGIVDNSQSRLPLIAQQRAGNGTIWELNGSGLWQWALQPELNSLPGRFYRKMWPATVRSLLENGEFLPGQEMSAATDKMQYSIRENVQIHILQRPGSFSPVPDMRVLEPNGAVAPLNNLFDGNVQTFAYVPNLSGSYQLQKKAARGNYETISEWTVSNENSEEQNTSPNPVLMKNLAVISGGKVMDLDQISDFAKNNISNIHEMKPVSEQHSLWDSRLILLVLTSILVSSWAIRRNNRI